MASAAMVNSPPAQSLRWEVQNGWVFSMDLEGPSVRMLDEVSSTGFNTEFFV